MSCYHHHHSAACCHCLPSESSLQTLATHLLHTTLNPHQSQILDHPTRNLLLRIQTLEASLLRISQGHYRHSGSLRDFAARTIQTHFRAHLVRRSKTLRDLEALAVINSRLHSLKLYASDRALLDPDSISREAMNLFCHLESIRGTNPMIRSGRRSITIELISFLEFVDGGVSVRKHLVSSRRMKNTVFAQNSLRFGVEVESFRNLRKEVHGFSRAFENVEGIYPASGEQIPSAFLTRKHGLAQVRNMAVTKRPVIQTKPKKAVSFSDSVNLPRVFSNTREPIYVNRGHGGAYMDDDKGLFAVDICKGPEEDNDELSRDNEDYNDDNEVNIENEESYSTSDGERNYCKRNSSSGNSHCIVKGSRVVPNVDFMFDAPLPVKMESIADLMGERKAAKNTTQLS